MRLHIGAVKRKHSYRRNERHTNVVFCCCFSPNENGENAMTLCQNRLILKTCVKYDN